MSKITAAQATMYQKIFSGTYWGEFEFTGESEQYINNRNKFVKDYHISKKYDGDFIGDCDQRLRNYGRGFDHFEFYEAKNGEIVFLNSPYLAHDDPECQKLIHLGMYQSLPLYSREAISFIKVFSDVTEFYYFCLQILGGQKDSYESKQEMNAYVKSSKKASKKDIGIDNISIDEKVYAILNEIEPAIKLAIAKALQQ